MKFSSNILAQALLDAVERDPKHVRIICENFIEFLRINRRLRNLPLILRNLQAVAHQKFGFKRATVVTTFPLTKQVRTTIETFVRDRTGARTVVLEEILDQSLIGGARISFDDTVIDFSVKTQLMKLVET